MTDDEVLQTRNDVEMMKRPHLWPHYPILPLKRNAPEHTTDAGSGASHHSRQLGVLLDGDGVCIRVHVCNMLDVNTCRFGNYPILSYDTPEEAVAAGKQ